MEDRKKPRKCIRKNAVVLKYLRLSVAGKKEVETCYSQLEKIT